MVALEPKRVLGRERRKGDAFNLGDAVYQITWLQAALTYYLMRGGIEDADDLATCVNADASAMRGVPLNDLFTFFDNAFFHIGPWPVNLPNVRDSCHVWCQNCGTRLAIVPCDCQHPANYGLAPPAVGDVRLSQDWDNGREDRRWRGLGRAEAGERTYHGGSVGE